VVVIINAAVSNLIERLRRRKLVERRGKAHMTGAVAANGEHDDAEQN
jgi:hypothetical protein